MATEVQSVLFPLATWSASDATNWLLANGLKAVKLDITKNMMRFRQTNPANYSRYYVKKLENGVELVIGVRKQARTARATRK